MCWLLKWPYGQSTIGSQYDKTTYISESTQISSLGLSGRGGGWSNSGGGQKGWVRKSPRAPLSPACAIRFACAIRCACAIHYYCTLDRCRHLFTIRLFVSDNIFVIKLLKIISIRYMHKYLFCNEIFVSDTDEFQSICDL